METASDALSDPEIKDIVAPEIKWMGENVKMAFKAPKQLMVLLI